MPAVMHATDSTQLGTRTRLHKHNSCQLHNWQEACECTLLASLVSTVASRLGVHGSAISGETNVAAEAEWLLSNRIIKMFNTARMQAAPHASTAIASK
mmetsp:Transcript_44794/g.117498  ORF Transcript_44794/g.117498 Transcript_44794/m.117498 type:complete len:98 (-) Transcript_44794:264-557(-)